MSNKRRGPRQDTITLFKNITIAEQDVSPHYRPIIHWPKDTNVMGHDTRSCVSIQDTSPGFKTCI